MLVSMAVEKFVIFCALLLPIATNAVGKGISELPKEGTIGGTTEIDDRFQGIEKTFAHLLEGISNASETYFKNLSWSLELLRSEQKKQHEFYANKITGLEFSLNHMLSKLICMSDRLDEEQQQHNTNQAPKKPLLAESTDDVISTRSTDVVQESENQLENALTLRLNNILRHVQNIEMDNCEKSQRKTSKSGTHVKKSHDSQNLDSQQLDEILRRLNSQLSVFRSQDFKQLLSLAKRSDKNLDNVLALVSQTDERLLAWFENDSGPTSNCQSMSEELLRFTQSSDILLKRIESIVSKFIEPKCTQPQSNPHNDNLKYDEFRIHGKTVKNSSTNGSDNRKRGALKSNCHELNEGLYEDGIYELGTAELNEANRDFYTRFCAFPTSGPGWTVIQNRGPFDDQENFNRSWNDYRNGFGQLNKDFWFGNEFIHRLTYRDNYELYIQLEDFNGTKAWLLYTLFRLDSERYNYNLLIVGYNGSIPDSFLFNNMLDFSTFDRRNDKTLDACCACAKSYGSGWWFNNCSKANLNGIYRDTPIGNNYVGIIWENWLGDYSLKRSRMLIRPRQIESTIGKADDDEVEYDTPNGDEYLGDP